jgi:hypothetical protein
MMRMISADRVSTFSGSSGSTQIRRTRLENAPIRGMHASLVEEHGLPDARLAAQKDHRHGRLGRTELRS